MDCCGPLDDLKIKEANNIELLNIFRKLEFDSLIAKMDLISVNKEDLPKVSENLNISNISSRSDLIKVLIYLSKNYCSSSVN